MDETKLTILEKTGSSDVQELVAEVRRLSAALEQISRSHPKLLMRGGQPAAWLVAKAALLGIPLGTGYESDKRVLAAVIAEWGKTEPRVLD